MARAMDDRSESDLGFLTDCMYFISGRCRLDENCRFRHCREAVEQINNCPRWPKKCRNITCPRRHPTIANKLAKKKPPVTQMLANHPCQPQLPTASQGSMVAFFWDIENVPIPRGQRPFDIVQRIRQKLVIERGLQEVEFSCYCNSESISKDNQQSLQHAAVTIVHVPDRKANGVDRQIMLHLDRFERVHRPPATVVLISGDIDFVGKLSDLRHHRGFHVIVIHNKPAKEELKATVHEHYPWEFFTEQHQPPINVANGYAPIGIDRNPRTTEPDHARRSSASRRRRRQDPSPLPQARPNMPQLANIKPGVTNYQCSMCDSTFETTQALRQHQTVKEHSLHCPVCNEPFVTKESRNQHQKDKKHYVLNYKCHQCNRFFSKIESLNQHQQATGHILSLSPLLSIPATVKDNKGNDRDPMEIILNGIEAIRQHFLEEFSKTH